MNYLLDEDYHSLTPPGIMNYLLDEDYHSLTPLGSHLSILLGDSESLSLTKSGISGPYWGNTEHVGTSEMRSRLSYLKKTVECRSTGGSRLRISKREQTISLRETTIY